MTETPRYGTTAYYLEHLAELLQAAQRPGQDPTCTLDALAKIQRVSGHAMRAAVSDCRGGDRPMTWRNLAVPAQMPFGTLYRQYQAGGRLVIHDLVPTKKVYELPDDADRLGA